MPVFIHSWHGDFAKTKIVSESEYLGRAARRQDPKLLLLGCGCGARHLYRVRRPSWMRVIPMFRLYRCVRCGADVFRPRTGQRRHYPVF